MYTANLPIPLANYTPSYLGSGFVFTFNHDIFKLVRTYDLYDSQGNILQYTDKQNNVSTSFIWGYNRSYPIAKIVGDKYTYFSNYFGGNQGIENLYYWGLTNIPTELTFNNINSLRNLLPNSMVSTYTYKPSIGMTSETDPRGITTYYEYDPFGRLETIKDENGNLIENYKYNYKTP